MSPRIWCCSLLIVVVFILPSYGASRGTCSEEKLRLAECATPFKSYVKSLKNVTGEEIMNREFMLKFLSFTGPIATCIGNVMCDESRHYRFFLDVMTYFGNILYKTAFPCIQDIRPIVDYCFRTTTTYAYVARREESRQSFLKCGLQELLQTTRATPCTRIITRDLELAAQAFSLFRNESMDWSRGAMKPIVFSVDKLKRLS